MSSMVQAGFYIDKRVKRALRRAALDRDITQTELGNLILAKALKVDLTAQIIEASNHLEDIEINIEEDEEITPPAEKLDPNVLDTVLEEIGNGKHSWQNLLGRFALNNPEQYLEEVVATCEDRGVQFIWDNGPGDVLYDSNKPTIYERP